MLYLNLLLISLIIIYIVDLSDAISTIKKALSYILTKGKVVTDKFSLRPFDCSFCSIFWVGLIYIICCNQFTIPNIAFTCLLSFISIPLKEALLLLKDMMTKLINIAYKRI